MSRIAIVDESTSEFNKDTSLSLQQLACEPCKTIMQNSRKADVKIDAVILSTTSDIQYGSTIISEYLGIKPTISQRLDNLCNSGTNAIVSAYSLIKSGLCKTALVVGADMKQTKGSRLAWDVSREVLPHLFTGLPYLQKPTCVNTVQQKNKWHQLQ